MLVNAPLLYMSFHCLYFNTKTHAALEPSDRPGVLMFEVLGRLKTGNETGVSAPEPELALYS